MKVLMPSAPPCWNWSRPGISSAPVSAMNADACVAVITSSMNVRRRSLPSLHRKDPEDKNHLLIDEETAPIVRLIFGYALNGHGPNYIRRRLEEEKIPCPTWWNRERGLRNTRTKWEKKDPENGRYMWDFSVIKDLLMNPVYTGAIASQKKDYRFKIGTIGEAPGWALYKNCGI